MGLNISFLLLLSAFLIFAQIKDYRRVDQRQTYDQSNKNTYPINRIKTTKVSWTKLNREQSMDGYSVSYFVNPGQDYHYKRNVTMLITINKSMSCFNYNKNLFYKMKAKIWGDISDIYYFLFYLYFVLYHIHKV